MGVEPQQSAADNGVLRRILCGVDGSPAGEEAVRQAVRLRAPEGRLLLASVATPAAAAHPDAAVAHEEHAAAALRPGRSVVLTEPAPGSKVRRGSGVVLYTT